MCVCVLLVILKCILFLQVIDAQARIGVEIRGSCVCVCLVDYIELTNSGFWIAFY